jgi:hypothetical protein
MIGSWDRDSKSRLLITNDGISFFFSFEIKKKRALIKKGLIFFFK